MFRKNILLGKKKKKDKFRSSMLHCFKSQDEGTIKDSPSFYLSNCLHKPFPAECLTLIGKICPNPPLPPSAHFCTFIPALEQQLVILAKLLGVNSGLIPVLNACSCVLLSLFVSISYLFPVKAHPSFRAAPFRYGQSTGRPPWGFSYPG